MLELVIIGVILYFLSIIIFIPLVLIKIKELKGLFSEHFKSFLITTIVFFLIEELYFFWRLSHYFYPELTDILQLYFDVLAFILILILAYLGLKLIKSIKEISEKFSFGV